MPECARQFGVLENFSAFPFENFLGQLKRRLRSGNRPLAQIVKRMLENEDQLAYSTSTESSNAAIKLQHGHCQAPLLPYQMKEGWQLFKLMPLPDKTRLNCRAPNNAVYLIDSSMLLMRNFCTSPDGTSWILGNRFRAKKDLYSYPLQSSELNIFCASEISHDMECWRADHITSKAVCI